MIDDLKSEKLINKVGGKFKLTALVQKRLNELVQGSRPLIEDAGGRTLLEIAVQEILQDKITIEGLAVTDKSQAGSEPSRKDEKKD